MLGGVPFAGLFFGGSGTIDARKHGVSSGQRGWGGITS